MSWRGFTVYRIQKSLLLVTSVAVEWTAAGKTECYSMNYMWYTHSDFFIRSIKKLGKVCIQSTLLKQNKHNKEYNRNVKPAVKKASGYSEMDIFF